MSIIEKVFHYEESELSVIKCKDEIWFRGKTIAEILGYAIQHKVIIDHVDPEDRRRQEMLGIQKIVSIKEYNATPKPFCNKCESYEWNHTISFKNGDKYLLCNGCIRFFKNIKNKDMAGIKDIKKVR